MTAKTPNYALEYLVPGEPVYLTRAALQRNAESIDAALTRGGVAPPAAQDLVALAARVTALEAAHTAAWASFVPSLSLTTSGSGLVQGDKTGWSGTYTKHGRTVTFTFVIQMTSTWNQGSGGSFRLTLPVAPRPVTPPRVDGGSNGSVWLWSGSAATLAVARIRADGFAEFIHQGSTVAAVTGSNAPFVWTTGCQIAGTVVYEAAS